MRREQSKLTSLPTSSAITTSRTGAVTLYEEISIFHYPFKFGGSKLTLTRLFLHWLHEFLDSVWCFREPLTILNFRTWTGVRIETRFARSRAMCIFSVDESQVTEYLYLEDWLQRRRSMSVFNSVGTSRTDSLEPRSLQIRLSVRGLQPNCKRKPLSAVMSAKVVHT